MESVIEGRVYKFGDNINSDIIIPGRYLIYIDRERLGQHAFEMLGEGFPDKLRELRYPRGGPEFRLRQRAGTSGDGDSGARDQSRSGKLICAHVLSQRHQRRASHHGMSRNSTRQSRRAIEFASTSKPAKSSSGTKSIRSRRCRNPFVKFSNWAASLNT